MTLAEFEDRLEAWTDERREAREQRAREILVLCRSWSTQPMSGPEIFELVTGKKLKGGTREDKLDALWQESHERAEREKAERARAAAEGR